MNTTYDMPDNYYFGGGGDTTLAPGALIVLMVAIICALTGSRRFLAVPLIAAVLLPIGAVVVVLGFHFPALRLLLIACWVRIALRRDVPMPLMSPIDRAFLVWSLGSAVCFSILWGTPGAVTNRLGVLWTTLGTYFLLRLLIRDKASVVEVIRLLAIAVSIIGPCMVAEHVTQRNAFSILGAPAISAIRAGSVRAEGPFSHPIIAGTIGASLLPLFIGLWWHGKQNRAILGVGMASSLAMMVSSSSSTPLMTCAAGLLALILWPLRCHLRVLRWGLTLSIVGLHLAMKAPVWMLISRTGGTIGGSGYHRAMLIDNFFRHFSEWWLIGTRTNGLWGYDMWDVDNAFVAAGVGGGLVAFIAFIAMFVYAYKQVGRSRRTAQSIKDERLIWSIGACLFANNVGYFGIVYFDQSVLIWYSLLAMISATALFSSDSNETRRSAIDKPRTEGEDWWTAPALSPSHEGHATIR